MSKHQNKDAFFTYRQRLGNTIRKLRKARGYTQEVFAMDIVKMNVSYLAKIENGYINTSLRYLVRIAKGLKVKVADLIEF